MSLDKAIQETERLLRPTPDKKTLSSYCLFCYGDEDCNKYIEKRLKKDNREYFNCIWHVIAVEQKEQDTKY